MKYVVVRDAPVYQLTFDLFQAQVFTFALTEVEEHFAGTQSDFDGEFVLHTLSL